MLTCHDCPNPVSTKPRGEPFAQQEDPGTSENKEIIQGKNTDQDYLSNSLSNAEQLWIDETGPPSHLQVHLQSHPTPFSAGKFNHPHEEPAGAS